VVAVQPEALSADFAASAAQIEAFGWAEQRVAGSLARLGAGGGGEFAE